MDIYDTVTSALRAHWAAHQDQYPQKLVLSPSQHTDLMHLRRLGLEGLNANAETMDTTRFMGVPVESYEGAQGALVAVDGSTTTLAI